MRRNKSLSSQDLRPLILLSVVLFALFSFLIIQFYKLQIVEGDRWQQRAKSQHELVVIDPPKRGVFYANSLKESHPSSLQPLVIDVPYYHLYVDPLSIPEACRGEIAEKLFQMVLVKKAEKERFLAHFDKKSHSRKLAAWIARDLQAEIIKWWFPYARAQKIPSNAIYFIEDYKRSYPFGSLLGQLLHTVREDRDPITQENIPTGGLETSFHEYLNGSFGKRLLFRSPRNPLDIGKALVSPENGADVYLTIDHCIQAIAEEEIAKGVIKANAKFGWAVMMDPFSGEILAFAQYPFFDPNNYHKYYNDPDLLEHTKVKAITDPFEPGSIMKPITMCIALLANEELKKQGKKPVFSPDEKIALNGGIFPGRRNKPIKDLSTHFFLNMYMGMQKSSNVYMGRIIQRVVEALGEEWYRNALEKIFGFGVKTGIELPSESSGFLPNPKNRNGWSVPTPYSLAMGYNLLANSLQAMRAWGILANGGYSVEPRLVRKIVKKRADGSEEILLDKTLPKEKTLLLPPSVLNEVLTAMKYVTKKGGTAVSGDIPGFTEIGKTSSSEKVVNGTYSKQVHFSTFIGFAPIKSPRFVLLISIDDPEYKYIPGIGKKHLGGHCSAPVFREIGLRTLQYLGVEPDDPYGYPVGDPRSDLEKAYWGKETQALKTLYESWNFR